MNNDRNLFDKMPNNAKHLWKIIKSKLCNNNKNEHSINKIYNKNKEIIKDQPKIVNIMSNFYWKMGKDISNIIKIPTNKKIELLPRINNSIFLKFTNSIEI